jgi:hypothetical protein
MVPWQNVPGRNVLGHNVPGWNVPATERSLGQNVPRTKYPFGTDSPSQIFWTKRTKCPRNFRDVLSFLTKHCTLWKNKIFLTTITYTVHLNPSLNFVQKMDQTGPEFFMKSYCGSGNSRSQGRIIFCRARWGWAAGAAAPGPGRRVRATGGLFCPRDVSLQNFWDEKSIGRFVRGRFVRVPYLCCGPYSSP